MKNVIERMPQAHANPMPHQPAVQYPSYGQGQYQPQPAEPSTFIGQVVREVAEHTQTDPQMPEISLLNSVSIASQSLIRVQHPNGRSTPVNLMTLCIAGSGERKSTVQDLFMQPILRFEQQQYAFHKKQMEEYQAQNRIWNTKQRQLDKALAKITADGGCSLAIEQDIKTHSQQRPVKPQAFKLVYKDPSPAQLFSTMSQSPLAAAGVVSSEAWGFFNGPMLRDVSKLNEGWSGEPIIVDRKNGHSYRIDDPKLTLALMIQPGQTLDAFVRNDLILDCGLAARFLVCRPQEQCGYRNIDPEKKQTPYLDEWVRRINILLERNFDAHHDPKHTPRTLELSPEAACHWKVLSQWIEGAMRPGGCLAYHKGYGSKLMDNVVRVAALAHYLDHFEHMEHPISVETLRSAFEVCRRCTENHIDLFPPKLDPETKQHIDDVIMLHEWFKDRFFDSEEDEYHCFQREQIEKSYILRHAPRSLRRVKRLNPALKTLQHIGHIFPIEYEREKKNQYFIVFEKIRTSITVRNVLPYIQRDTLH